ncbi:MAG: Hsp20/alpha crystallin family protein [Phycisphaeraceae bacterium]|nr:Hsp20/alpha crystallin family protein [Phycisphaeraceae bacterium]
MSIIPFKNRNNNNEPEGFLPATVGELKHEMDRLFERFVGRYPSDVWNGLTTGTWNTSSLGAWSPAIDIAETDKEVVIRAEIPGVDPKDVEVAVAGTTLTISGEKEETEEESGKDFHRSERRFGSFERRLTLPDYVDPDKVAAGFANGVLEVRVAKTKAVQPRKIAVTGSGSKK